MSDGEVTRTDVLVVGAGAAGMVAALQAARLADVLLLSAAGPVGESSSNNAQGGIAAVLGDDDTIALHAEDTLRAGRGLCSLQAVDTLVSEGPTWVELLSRLGVPFGSEQGLEGGHSRRRIRQVGGAATGHAVSIALGAAVSREPRIRLAAGERVLALWIQDGCCVGVQTDRRRVAARATVLATGGYAALYSRTTNPPGSRGEGITLAFAAGAVVADLEMVQFHPTALATTGLLLSEALRGDGAVLLDERGERFTDELAPRDEVARAIYARPHVTLDLRPVAREHFPELMAAIRAAGFDPDREPVPVSPAAHYTMGGIKTDLDGRTNVPGLFAAGECACTGVHGANRLASNSLLECLVFGGRAGRAAVDEPLLPALAPWTPTPAVDEATDAVRAALWRGAGVVRSRESLAALAEVPHTLGRLVGELAACREESRGSHFRSDFPRENPHMAKHLVRSRDTGVRWEAWR